jgi:hypothetical protein
MLSIPKPCNEDFSAMTPTERGAYCGKCQIDTYDFKGMSNLEIKEVLEESRGKQICGQFYVDQIDYYNLTYFGKVIRKRRYSYYLNTIILSLIMFSCQTTGTTKKSLVKSKSLNAYIAEEKFISVKPKRAEEIEYEVPSIELFDEDLFGDVEYECTQKEPIEIVGDPIEIRAEVRQKLSGDLQMSGGVPVETRYQDEIEPKKEGFFKKWLNRRKNKKSQKD